MIPHNATSRDQDGRNSTHVEKVLQGIVQHLIGGGLALFHVFGAQHSRTAWP